MDRLDVIALFVRVVDSGSFSAVARTLSVGQPAVMIRLLDALARIMAETTSEGQRRVLLEQAEMINRACERSVPEADRRVYAKAYAQPGAMRAGFEYFRNFERDAEDFARRSAAFNRARRRRFRCMRSRRRST